MHLPGTWRRGVSRIDRRIRLGLLPLEDRSTPATVVWDGGGADNLWTTAANWSAGGEDRIPVPSDDVVFDGSSDKPATVDNTFLVNSVTVNPGYDGVITVAGGSTLAITGGLTVGSGTFDHAGDVLSVQGNVLVTGGTLAFTGNDFIVDGDWIVAPTASFGHSSSSPVTFNRATGLQRLSTGGTGADHDFRALRHLGEGTLRLQDHDLVITESLELEGGGIFLANGRAVAVGGLTAIREDSTYQGGSALQSFGGGLNLGLGTLSGDNLRLGGPISSGQDASGTAVVTGHLDLGGAVRTITVGGADDVLIIAAAVANGGIVKAGGGALRLDGNSTYGGPTTVESGTLLVVGSIPGPVVVTGGFFGGIGQVGNVAAPGGEVAPGAGAAGVLTTANLALGGATPLRIELGGAATGQFDQLVVNGTVELGGGPLTVTSLNGYAPPLGQRFVLISNDGADPVGGTFSGLPEGASLTLNGQLFQISYVGGDGNDVELTATSPPPPPPLPPPPPPGTLPPPVLIGAPHFGAGADVGGTGTARVFRPDGSERFALEAFADSPGGVRTAVGDFTGDGVPDLAVGTGPGSRARVRVFDGQTREEIFAAVPFEESYTGGVFLAAGDLTGDGQAELVISPDVGGGPRVRIFGGAAFAQVNDFFGIEDLNFRGGARVAVADVTGDRIGDVIVAAGTGGGPRVATYDGTSVRTGTPTPTKPYGDFFVFENTLRNGVFIAGGDVNGDGFADVIAGGGPGGGPRVFALSGRDLLVGRTVQLANFFAGDPSSRGGVRVVVKNLDDDARADLVTGDGPGRGAIVRGYRGSTITPEGTPQEVLAVDAFPGFTGGVFVG